MSTAAQRARTESGVLPKTTWLLSVLLILGTSTMSTCVRPAAARTQAAAQVDLRPALGKGFDAYEKLFGKPVRSGTSMNESGEEIGKSRTYKRAGFVYISLSQQDADYVTSVSLGFPETEVKSWKPALERLSLPTAGVGLGKAQRDDPKGGAFFPLTGMPEGWKGYWLPNDGDTKSHLLVLYPEPK